MNAKLWACVIVGVLVAHMALLFIIDHIREFGKPLPPVPKPPAPPFEVTTIRYRDEKGADVKVVREFKVSTKLADPETLKKLPPPPKAAAMEVVN